MADRSDKQETRATRQLILLRWQTFIKSYNQQVNEVLRQVSYYTKTIITFERDALKLQEYFL